MKIRFKYVYDSKHNHRKKFTLIWLLKHISHKTNVSLNGKFLKLWKNMMKVSCYNEYNFSKYEEIIKCAL